MQVIVNGQKREITASATLAELLRELNVSAPHFAVALNCNVVPKSQYAETGIREGDAVEIVHAVGGGV